MPGATAKAMGDRPIGAVATVGWSGFIRVHLRPE